MKRLEKRPKVCIKLGQKVRDKKFGKESSGKTREKTREIIREKTREIIREKTREKILGLVCTSANISTDEMATQLGVTRKGIEWHIRKLKAENLLRRIGPDKGGHWEVLK